MRVLILADLADLADDGARAPDLAAELSARGHDVELLAPDRGVPGGPHARLVPEQPPMIPAWDQVAGALQRDLALLEHGITEAMRAPIDVVHAFGWRTAYAAAGLREAFAVPVVASFDRPRRLARRRRVWGRGDELIEATETWLAALAVTVTVRSQAAARAVIEYLEVPRARLEVIPTPRAREAARRRALLAERFEPLYAAARDARAVAPALVRS